MRCLGKIDVVHMSDENRDHAGHLDFRVSENHIKPCIVLRSKCKVVSELGPFEHNLMPINSFL